MSNDTIEEKKVYEVLHFLSKSDSDIIQKLNNVDNKTDYIQELIRKDINKAKEND